VRIAGTAYLIAMEKREAQEFYDQNITSLEKSSEGEIEHSFLAPQLKKMCKEKTTFVRF
jgi:hypothetical protein